MSRMTDNQLRRLRKSTGLTQKELAYLTGLDNATSVSRIERSIRMPNVTALLALQRIFQRPSEELVPELVREVERMVIIRAKTLCRSTMSNMNARDFKHKHKVLNAISEGQPPVEPAVLWKTVNTGKN